MLPRLLAAQPDSEILVVDDGSVDAMELSDYLHQIWRFSFADRTYFSKFQLRGGDTRPY
jgi:hypothetical protein